MSGDITVTVITTPPPPSSPPGPSLHGMLQARTLQWVACNYSRGSSQPRGRTRVSCWAGDSLPLSHLGSCPFYLITGNASRLTLKMGPSRDNSRLLQQDSEGHSELSPIKLKSSLGICGPQGQCKACTGAGWWLWLQGDSFFPQCQA